MKKLLSLLVMLLAFTASGYAGTQTVYFSPGTNWASESARFALYMFDDGTGTNSWADFDYNSTLGVYEATYDDAYTDGIIICRMNPSTTVNAWEYKWNQSANLAVPTSAVYYTMTEEGTDWDKFTFTATTPSTYTFTLRGNSSDPILANYTDANSAASNVFESNGDFTYTLAVSNTVAPAATYGFKIEGSNGTWYGDLDNSWDWYSLPVAADGVYNITYTFNYITQRAAYVLTKKSDATLSEKYVVAGNKEFFTQDWDVSGAYNEMTVSAGVATLDFNDVELTPYYNEYKVVHVLLNDGTRYKSTWYGDPDNSYANYGINIEKSSKYNVGISFDISTLKATTTVAEQFTGYYVVGGTGSAAWTVGDALTESSGIYSITLSGKPNYRFAIVPNTAINASNEVTDWSVLLRPDETGNEGKDDYVINFANYSGQPTTTTNRNQAWKINTANDEDYEFSYTSATGKFDITSSDQVTITSAGYATYSNAAAYKISGCEAYTVTAATTSATLNKLADNAELPAGTGVIIKGDAGDYTVTPSAGTADVTGNMLIGSGNYTYVINQEDYTAYILANYESVLGFYKVKADDKTLAAHKAFLKVTSGGAPEFLGFGADVTGINEVKGSGLKVQDAVVYDLQGRRVITPARGLYIVNGRKVVIK